MFALMVASKKVDLIAQQLSFGKLGTRAIECKDLAHRLDRDEIAASYEEVLARPENGELLIVTRNGMTDSGSFTCGRISVLAYSTVSKKKDLNASESAR